MAKQLKFTYNDKDYTLEYTRKTITELEKNGLVVGDIESKPMTILPQLFEGAFLAHHRFEKKEVIDEIYNKMPNKEDLIGKLAEMYNDPIVALLEDPKDKEGNVDWTTNW